MSDLIERQAAIEALYDWEMTYDWDDHCRKEDPKPAYIVSPSDVIEELPSAQSEPSQVARDIATIIENEQDMMVIERNAQRWIPCSEKPDTERNVFVARGTSESMSVCVGHYDHGLEQWYEDRNWFAKCLYDGMYWCEIPPLPEPYKGEQE